MFATSVIGGGGIYSYPYSFQWYKGSTLLPGQTNDTLVLSGITAGDAGAYTVVVTGSCGDPASSSATLTVPLDGNLWTVQAAAGEYVRKGQELFTVLDCSTVLVTASVSERDYNELRLSEPVRFRVSGSGREYHGHIAKLGLTSTGRSFAISPEERRHQVAVQLSDLVEDAGDRCSVGRTGEVVFEGGGQGVSARLVESMRHLLGLS